MIKKKYDFQSCSSTAGSPFDDKPKCPLFLRCDEHLTSNGWNKIFYNSFKTGRGDLCNTKYKRMEQSENVLSMLEISIEGTKNTCCLTAVINTYRPEKILNSIHHECEGEIIKDLDTLFEKHTLSI